MGICKFEEGKASNMAKSGKLFGPLDLIIHREGID
jgi:hypothetical protein